LIFRTIYDLYYSSLSGFSKQIWWLALATLINRAGAMVLPFLSLYLNTERGFTIGEIGWVMSFYGLGSLIGAWSGGEITHRIGAYYTMILSLVTGGLSFFIIPYLGNFWLIIMGIFTSALLNDIFRPAVFVSLATYAKPNNRIRAITLIRLAINLGFSLGPAVGGILIVGLGYSSLFWIDGISCIIASVILFSFLERKNNVIKSNEVENKKSHFQIITDFKFMLFLLAVLLFSVVFIQYFSVMPIYYKSVLNFSEDEVGWLLSLNGLLIFLIEMPLIYLLEKKLFPTFNIIIISSIFLLFSFIILFIPSSSLFIPVAGMILATFAEMLCFPFSNNYSMERAGTGNEGRYMAYYSMTFSLSHIFGHNIGLQTIDFFNYTTLFILLCSLVIASAIIFWTISRKKT
jgi:predicted MFS family arabinose efflux permease